MEPRRRTSRELDAVRARVRTLAEAHGGVFRRSDLITWGLDPTLTLTMRRNGAWVRLHHGVYADHQTVVDADTLHTRHLLLAAAAVSAMSGEVALFGPTASLAAELPVDRDALRLVQLVRPLGSDSRALRRRISSKDRLPSAVIHVIDMADEELIIHRGLPSVSRELAAWSTALMSNPDWAVATMDAAAWQSTESLERMRDYGERWQRLAGAGTARRALEHVRTGSQSPLESISRVKLIRAGLPEPVLQPPLYDRQGLVGYADMLFEELGVVGEADGHAKYETRDDLVREKVREDRIRALGFGVVRWGWSDATGSMRDVVARIRQASQAAGRFRSA